MAVPDQVPLTLHTGNGVTTIFPYQFLLLSADDAKVMVDGVTLTNGVAYSVDGIGDPAGGSVTFFAAPAAGVLIALGRSVVLARTTDYQYSGDFQSDTVNTDFDRLWMAQQDAAKAVSNAVTTPIDEVVPQVLPAVAVRRSKMLMFDASTGNVIVTPFTSDQVKNTIDAAYAGSAGPLDALSYTQAGVGPQVRSPQAKIREHVSVFDYMTVAEIADCQSANPTMNHTASIQKAYDAAARIGGLYVTNMQGGRVEWPTGRYNISQIVHRNWVRTIGTSQHSFGGGGYGTIIKQIAGTNKDMFVFEAQGTSGAPNYFCGPLTMEGVSLVGDFTATAGSAIKCVDVNGNALTPQDQFLIRDLTIWGFAEHGMHFPNGGTPLHIQDVVVDFCGGHGIYYYDQGINVVGRTQIISFINVSGDGNLGSVIRTENLNSYAAVTIFNTKSEMRPNNQRGYMLATAVASISGGAVTALTLTNPVGVAPGGAKYSSPPSVVFRGGDGTGAAATAIVSGGVVTGFTITNGGSGYTIAPSVSLNGGGVSGSEGAVIDIVSCEGAFDIIGASSISSVFNLDFSAGQYPPPVIRLSGTKIPQSLRWGALGKRNHPNQTGTPAVYMIDTVNGVTIDDRQGMYGSDPTIHRLNDNGRILAKDGTTFRRFLSYEGGIFQAGAPNNDYANDVNFNLRANKFGKVNVGNNGVNRVVVDETGVHPAADNAVSCGTSTLRFSTFWGANGAIQTSDERSKMDIEDSPLGLDFVLGLRPVSYRFKVGGRTQSVVIDESGQEVEVVQDRPGVRVHYGFLSQQVRSLVDAAGVDFGGWVKTDRDDPDSEEGLRYEEFIAPMVRAMQEMHAQIADLRGRLDDGEGVPA